MHTHSVTIVGAGICGLSLADLLKQQDKTSFVIEKSKSVGGRVATRRHGEAVFDHGAQFYKHFTERPIFWHERMQSQKVSRLWFTDEKGAENFVADPGMTKIAKKLQSSCTEIKFDELVIKILPHPDHLRIICDSGASYVTKKIVLTCPMPQSLSILKASGISYPAELEQIQYAKALVGLFEVTPNEAIETKDISFLKPGNEIFSIANNQHKKISPIPSYTVVMDPDFSEKHFNKTDEEILNLIEPLFVEQLSSSRKISFRQLKKWRYSHPVNVFREKFYQIKDVPEVFLAGDAFGGGSVYGAVQSTMAIEKVL